MGATGAAVAQSAVVVVVLATGTVPPAVEPARSRHQQTASRRVAVEVVLPDSVWARPGAPPSWPWPAAGVEARVSGSATEGAPRPDPVVWVRQEEHHPLSAREPSGPTVTGRVGRAGPEVDRVVPVAGAPVVNRTDRPVRVRTVVRAATAETAVRSLTKAVAAAVAAVAATRVVEAAVATTVSGATTPVVVVVVAPPMLRRPTTRARRSARDRSAAPLRRTEPLDTSA